MEATATMRAKMQVQEVRSFGDGEQVEFSAVTGNTPFGQDGESDDNTYARWTPSGRLTLTISNPALLGKFRVGQKFYLDFTEASE